jgi:hypothetical protein
MPEKYSVEELRNEIRELRETVSVLRRTVGELNLRLDQTKAAQKKPSQEGAYKVFSNREVLIEGNMSWNRLVGLLKDADEGLTASEAASKWGRSRSRTSEVLNKLADEGHIEKYRDGRRIRFRSRHR